MQNVYSGNSQYKYFEPFEAIKYEVFIDRFQPVYWYAHSLDEAKEKMINFYKQMNLRTNN